MNNKIKKHIFLKIILLVFLSLIGIIFTYLLTGHYAPQEKSIHAMISDNQVLVIADKNIIVLQPIDKEPNKTAFIFYPGGKIEPESYTPIIKEIAKEGYPCIIIKMPFNLAFTGINRIESFYGDAYDRYVLCGHSLGGTMAAQYIFNNPNTIDGLILWASSPGNSADISKFDIPVASIYGSLDMGYEKIIANKVLLPKNTDYTEIKGGNHAQFGDYGFQKGDNPATISMEVQQDEILKSTLDFLGNISK